MFSFSFQAPAAGLPALQRAMWTSPALPWSLTAIRPWGAWTSSTSASNATGFTPASGSGTGHGTHGFYINPQMMQAWRLFRFIMKLSSQALEEEEEDNIEFKKRMEGLPGLQKIAKRKEREELKKKKKREEKKKEEMCLLEFVREVVEITLDRHSEVNRNIPARLGATRLSSTSQEAVRLDMSRIHLIVRSTITGRCKLCSKRSFYRGVDLSPKF